MPRVTWHATCLHHDGGRPFLKYEDILQRGVMKRARLGCWYRHSLAGCNDLGVISAAATVRWWIEYHFINESAPLQEHIRGRCTAPVFPSHTYSDCLKRLILFAPPPESFYIAAAGHRVEAGSPYY